ncbi:MAG: cysteine desulfurase [Muribaculaceae bacterium]|nr:cysteine desulfurase [Muribaculaceae bacterium]
MYDVEKIRGMFPSLEAVSENGRPLIYLDNTATTQTPRVVVEAIEDSYYHSKANVHRGVHTLSQEATARQESTRESIRRFINARSTQEIIFTSGATESINLVASSLGELIPGGSEIILTVMEHHANIVPWQLLQSRKDLTIRVVDINDVGELDLEQYKSLFNEKTALAAFCHVSNVLGTVNPVKEMVEIAKEHGAYTLIDGAQGPGHVPVDVQEIGCDFYAFSAHKMYGPTGVGVLYGREEILEKMPPYQGGGEMIKNVSFSGTTFAELPFKFEAGTPNFVDLAAYKYAVEFVEADFYKESATHELELMKYCQERLLGEVPGMRIFGLAPKKSAIISFLVGDSHPYDVGMLLDGLGIAVRTGHHCAEPLMNRLGIPGTVRAGLACYNTKEEVDAFIDATKRVAAMLG